MIIDSGMIALSVVSDVGGHRPVFVKAFDGSLCDSYIKLLSDQRMGNNVVMAIHFNVIVDVDPCLFPFGELIGLLRKRF